MALIIRGKTECSLCGRIIRAGDDIVSTSHFISEQHDPLWQFSDSAMHRYCFLDWDHREDFVEKFNRTAEGTTGKYHRMESNGDVSLKRGG